MAYASENNITGFSASQCGWSLARTNPAKQGEMGIYYVGDDALAWHRRTGFPHLAFGSQAQGFFSQPWSWPDLPSPTPKQKALSDAYFSEANVARFHRADEIAKKKGVAINTIALAYVTSQSFPSIALVGPNTLEQLHSCLEAADLVLSTEEIAILDK